MKLPIVLVLEDDNDWHNYWQKKLSEKTTYLRTQTISAALHDFNLTPEIAAIVVDACVPGDSPNTMSFVKKARETYKGPMIACSNMPSYRRQLLDAGCDHQCDKASLPETLQLILQI